MYEEKEPTQKEVKKQSNKSKRFFQEKSTKNKEKKIKKAKTKEEKKTVEKKEKKIISFKADWVGILVKFGVFLLIAFFVIFTVTKIRNIGAKNTFTDNLEKMKDLSYVYYKVASHRPLGVNEAVEMTLGDMEDANLIKELKVKKDICSKDYSYVSLTKKDDNDNYLLEVYLSCGGSAEKANYDVSYKSSGATEEVTLYELKRTVKATEKYTCPQGYLNAGRNCVGVSTTEVISASPRYKVTPAKDMAARFKAKGYEYEYVDPIVSQSNESYRCSSGYDLIDDKCIKTVEPTYQTDTSYTCPDGSTPAGSRCLYTTSANYSDEQAYCVRGKLINGDSCYVTKDYSVKCITGKKDSNINACYTTYAAAKELSDWLFDSKVKKSINYEPKDTDMVKYEYDYDYNDNTVVYKKYIRKYIKVCDEGDELSGNICKHYDESYEQRYCSGSDYHMSSDNSECYTYVDAKYRTTKGSYKCPNGYYKRGTGSSTSCYKYEPAVKNTTKKPKCVSGYDLTKDNKCVKTVNATKVESKFIYDCPAGYTKSGTGASTKCYKRTTTDSYYYCANSKAQLSGTRCIIPATTSFVSYQCPSGYSLKGDKCYRTKKGDTILATENDITTDRTETIWSKEKEVEGWTWTGNTKTEKE